MIFEGYDAFNDPYVYPGTSVLKNLLDIQDVQTLEAFEIEISTLRAEEALPAGHLDVAHYCSVHHHLFQDVYAWAGTYRTVRTAKGGNMFCYPEHISAQMDQLFGSIKNGSIFQIQKTEDFVRRLAEFLAELNAIHPFREGNGRTQLAFIGLIAETFKQPLQLERLNRETFIPAMIRSFNSDLNPLIAELMLLRS